MLNLFYDFLPVPARSHDNYINPFYQPFACPLFSIVSTYHLASCKAAHLTVLGMPKKQRSFIIIIMFSKIRTLVPLLTPKIRYSFGPKKSLRDQMKGSLINAKQQTKNKQQNYIHIGLYGLVFALCFAALPLYRTFCEHIGLVGNNDKKVYNFKNKEIINLKKYKVRFIGQPQTDVDWEFEPVEKEVIIGASETAIVFYRLRNREKRPIVGFSTYNISPEEANTYFSKIQCFCFNQQMINPEEELLLPLFFYLQPEINEDPDVSRIHEVTVNYQFHESINQDLAKFAAEEIKRIEENKMKLNMMRAAKKEMSLEDYENHLLQVEAEGDEQPLVIDRKLPEGSKVNQPPKPTLDAQPQNISKVTPNTPSPSSRSSSQAPTARQTASSK